MLRTFQQYSEWRNLVAPTVAILLISAILLVFVLPIIDGGFDEIAFVLPVIVFFVVPTGVASRWVLSKEFIGPIEPLLNVFAGRAPPTC